MKKNITILLLIIVCATFFDIVKSVETCSVLNRINSAHIICPCAYTDAEAVIMIGDNFELQPEKNV